MGETKENGQCLKPGLGCFVIAWISVATIALILSYFIARSNGDISFIVPSISDTTYKDPEGAIFAEFFNATAILTLVMMAVRYFQIKMINREIEGSESSHLAQLNLLSNVLGIGSAVGVSIVANFRSREVDNPLSAVHIIGAVLLFVSGAAYCWAQTFITYQLTKFNVNTKSMFLGRLVISSVLTLSVLVFLVCGGLDSRTSMIKPIEIAGNIAEWLAAWCFGAFGISFCKEFQKLSLNIQCIPRCSGQSSDVLKYSTIPVSEADDNATDTD